MKSYIVGNWKMNFSVGESSVYLHKLQQKIRAFRSVEVIVAPSLIALQPLSLQIDRKKLRLAAQTANPHDFGAYTGEVSFTQLRGVVDYCIIGIPSDANCFMRATKTSAPRSRQLYVIKSPPFFALVKPKLSTLLAKLTTSFVISF